MKEKEKHMDFKGKLGEKKWKKRKGKTFGFFWKPAQFQTTRTWPKLCIFTDNFEMLFLLYFSSRSSLSPKMDNKVGTSTKNCSIFFSLRDERNKMEDKKEVVHDWGVLFAYWAEPKELRKPQAIRSEHARFVLSSEILWVDLWIYYIR